MTARQARLVDLIRAAAWHRRLLAGGLAAAAVAFALHALEPQPPPTVQVLAATDDLVGGVPLTRSDLRSVALPQESVPAGALRPGTDPSGVRLAGPVRAGEVITDVRVLGPGLLDGWGQGLVATPVRITDPGATDLLRTGDRIDLIAAAVSGDSAATVVAAGVPVLTVPPAGDGGLMAEGALVVVGTSRAQAAELAAVAVTSRLTLALRPS